MSPVVRPCIERLPEGRGCPEYADPKNGTRCAEHYREAMAKRDLSPGTTPEWRRARKIALKRAGYACEKCGKTDAQSRAEGKGGLHVHHIDGRGTRAKLHDEAMLEVRCPPCHRLTLKRDTRPSFREQMAERARARRAASQEAPPRA